MFELEDLQRNLRVSPGAEEALARAEESAEDLLSRHPRGGHKSRMYTLSTGEKVWVISAPGSDEVKILLPEDLRRTRNRGGSHRYAAEPREEWQEEPEEEQQEGSREKQREQPREERREESREERAEGPTEEGQKQPEEEHREEPGKGHREEPGEEHREPNRSSSGIGLGRIAREVYERFLTRRAK